MKSTTTNLVLAPDAPIDLQLHTHFSDGAWMPEALIDHLVREGFALAAITDHDRADTVAVLQGLAAARQFPLLVAVEITASWRGEMTDMLCYGFDPEKPALLEVAGDIIRRQRENTQAVYEHLLGQGFIFPSEPGQPNALTVLLDKPSSQQPHALVALMKAHGYGTPERSAGKILLEAGLTFATAEIATVVDAAHRSDALCLIAHPGRTDGFVTYDVALLGELRQEAPVDGLEVYYPAHTPEQVTTYLDYARKHNLLTSSGSDSHSPDKPPIKYPAEYSRNLLERLGIQVK